MKMSIPLVLSDGALQFSVEIRQSTIQYAGLLGLWDKRLIDHVSDAPGIFFFIVSYGLRAPKTRYFHFCNFEKRNRNKLKGVLQRILEDFMNQE